MDRMPFFNFAYPEQWELLADIRKSEGERQVFPCPANADHYEGDRRISELYLEVQHNDRAEQVIWGDGCAIHESILESFSREGFTGYRTKPATVCFQDGTISREYRELVITGWAGVARKESGMQIVESCPSCHWGWYSPIKDYSKVIDWDQWTGDDFFVVWPLRGMILCTERVAVWLKRNSVRSLTLEKGFAVLEECKALSNAKTFGGRLSSFFPEDLAIKYGRAIGLE